jgi:hypothetical protein
MVKKYYNYHFPIPIKDGKGAILDTRRIRVRDAHSHIIADMLEGFWVFESPIKYITSSSINVCGIDTYLVSVYSEKKIKNVDVSFQHIDNTKWTSRQGFILPSSRKKVPLPTMNPIWC